MGQPCIKRQAKAAVIYDQVLGPDTMFRGKNLLLFLEQQAPLFRRLVEQYGIEKVNKVYDYFFAFTARLKWGQWMVLSKVCPDRGQRMLFFWAMEMIYQSDLLSQFRFDYVSLDRSRQEVRLLIVPPVESVRQQWIDLGLVANDHYKLYDWYGNYRLNQDINPPGIDPVWLMLQPKSRGSEWGIGVTEDSALPADPADDQ